MKQEKEYLVFLLPAGRVEDVNAEEIDDWAHSEELPDEAKDFIEKAKLYNCVYTLKQFMFSFNYEEIGFDDYIFITNKY